ncbi:DivIVA domain-containing protein [Salinispora arenicola]|uniref:Antigen 84 n=1 Tax=Salinispora arenicola (strain CNS-205) TaxID=391037 RepID=A8LZA7_SALAI|nr:DivIVA domain-containing protein [Salinispora arenicola]MCN0178020.1 DivIVA domain-containing protein [Salinispora arenicola]
MVDMRNPFRRFRRWKNRPAPRHPTARGSALISGNVGHHAVDASHVDGRRQAVGNAGGHYRSAARWPLSPGQVRGRQFTPARRGIDPTEVELFLSRVADDLAALHAELGRTRDENVRIKRALRDWQSRFTPGVRV